MPAPLGSRRLFQVLILHRPAESWLASTGFETEGALMAKVYGICEITAIHRRFKTKLRLYGNSSNGLCVTGANYGAHCINTKCPRYSWHDVVPAGNLEATERICRSFLFKEAAKNTAPGMR